MTTIREIRTKLGMTQKEFAEEFHIPFKTLQRWEYGSNRTPEHVIYMLERIYNDMQREPHNS